MTEPAMTGALVAKKKTTPKGEQKQYGTLIRVSDEFAEAMREAAGFEQVSMRDFADLHLLPVVRKRFREAVIRKAKGFGGKDQ